MTGSRKTTYRRFLTLEYDEWGFSLVEVMVTIVLLGLVMGSLASLFSFGTALYASNEKQANIQQDVRLAARIISEAIRYARSIEILAEAGMDEEENGVDKPLIYVKEHKIIKKENGREAVIAGHDEVEFSLLFQTEASRILGFTITSTSGKQQYSISSSVLGLNLEYELPMSDGIAIRYVGVE